MNKRHKDAKDAVLHGYARANSRIPHWAEHPEYMCSRIIRAFFLVADANYVASSGNIRLHCSDRDGAPELYVEKFRGNWASLKTDAGNQNGKVFEEDRQGRVTIWPVVRTVLLAHREEFIG